MTTQACFVILCKQGQFRLGFMADATLLVEWLFGIQVVRSITGKTCLVRVMTYQAVFIGLRGVYSSTPMLVFFKRLLHTVVARQALLGVKKIFQVLVNQGRVRMQPSIRDIRVAILAGQLTMGRDMERFDIHRPAGFSNGPTEQQINKNG